jgi:hypothetical protein
MRKAVLTTAVLVAAVVFFLLATLPPAARRAEWGGDPSIPGRTVGGAFHVHTSRSDGAKDRAAVAAAAARAGLQFVIFTDHGDATRDPEPPAYLSGVLCVDGVEISTNGGHYVAIGLPRAPYPLGGEPFAVVEDVARLGGFGFAAHVDSPKPELAWSDWDVAFDGVEWMNADSQWRDEPRGRLARSLFDYFVRPGPALASLLDRPAGTLARWDALTAQRPVVAIAGHDAHGGFGGGVEDAGGRRVPLPSYEASFRTFSTRVILDAPLSGDAAADARRLLDAIRAGRVFTSIDALASPAYVDFRANESTVTLDVSMPPGAQLVVMHRGKEAASVDRGRFVTALEGLSGALRAEVRVPGAPGTPPVPWLVTNPIYLGIPEPQVRASDLPSVIVPFPDDVPWHPEHDPTSRGQTRVTPGSDKTFDFRLGAPPRASQFAALVADMPGRIPPFERLTFDVRASQPMRVSVQLRYGEGGGQRWARSVYLDPEVRHVSVALRDLLPVDGQTGSAPDPANARSILFVVDLTNATPGTAGTFQISNLLFLR